MDELEAKARIALGNTVYGEDEATFEGAIGRLLQERGLSVATIETASGGLLAHALGGVPDSAAAFRGE